MNRVILWLVCLPIIILPACQNRPESADYKNPSLVPAKRAKDLLTRMTLEEKVAQLQCLFTYPDSTAIDSNGLGHLCSVFGNLSPAEAAREYNSMQSYAMRTSRWSIPVTMHGEAVFGLMAYACSSFPQPIAQAATFNPELQYRMARAIANEALSRGYRQVLSPNVNIANDVRWGRLHETYGEDPWLASRMGVAFVKAMEERGIMATPKHYIANIGENGAFGGPVHYSERILREVFLPPFEAVVREAKASSIMPAYNSSDGIPCTANDWLLNKVLRNEWGFDGFTSSDYGAVSFLKSLHQSADTRRATAAQAMAAGLDVELPGVDIYGKDLIEAVRSGMIREALVDKAVYRVLLKKFEKGLFEQPYVDPAQALTICDNREHRLLALEMARQSIVLLKNDSNTLPFPATLKSIAVLGPLANDLRLGNYAGWGMKTVTILEGIRHLLDSTVEVRYAKGVEFGEVDLPAIAPEFVTRPDDGKKGWKAEYFGNIRLEGKPLVTRTESSINHNWGVAVPDPLVAADGYSVRWTGVLKSPVSGAVTLGITMDDGAKVYLNGQCIIDQWKSGEARLAKTTIHLEKNKQYSLQVEYYEGAFNAVARLGWDAMPSEDIKKAIAEAARSDAAIIVVGAPDGEGTDRAILDLSAGQEELIKQVAALGKPMAVVLATGNVITINQWVAQVPAILTAWYPGEEGGNAIAEVLFGRYNPGGKLPVTFPKHVGQVPCYYYQKPNGTGTSFIDIGNDPQFCFGHGLSYTSFSFDKIHLSSATITPNDELRLSIEVSNTGKLAGEEVVQVYLKDLVSSVVTPGKILKRFKRIRLEPGERVLVSFSLQPSDFALLDKNLKKTVEPGQFLIMVGNSSCDILQTAKLVVAP